MTAIRAGPDAPDSVERGLASALPSSVSMAIAGFHAIIPAGDRLRAIVAEAQRLLSTCGD